MSGVPISAFTETVRLTGPTVFTGVREVVNDAQKTNYNTLGYLMRGQSMSDVVQGGLQIVDDIQLATVRKARTYRPGNKQSYTNPQTGVQIAVPWRMFLTDITWDDTERELNEGSGRAGDRSLRYKDVWFKKQMNSYVDWCDYQEELFWLPGDPSRMEAANGDLINSIPFLINEFASGQVGSGNPSGTAATTKLGILPTAAGMTRWDNQRFSYQNAGVGSNMNPASLMAVLKKATQALQFKPAPMHGQYFEAAANTSPGNWIACSSNGLAFIWQQYLASQNRWDNQMDPNGNPMFNGVPFVHVAALDGALLYPTGSNAAIASATWSTEGARVNTGVDNAGPRFKLISSKYLRAVYHEKFTMSNLGVMDDRAQPTSHTMPLLTWMNLMPRSLWRHGEVYPSGLTGSGITAESGAECAHVTGFPTT